MQKKRQQTPLIIGFEGTRLDRQWRRHLQEIDPAGVILFRRNIQSLEQTRDLVGELKDLLTEAIISVDHEGGIVNRFPADCPVPPSPAALHASGSLDLVRSACRIQAQLLSYLGINLNFVPLVDLALHLENQVIGTRAFSSDPKKVAAFARISVQEHSKLGIGTTAKHFPTHGRSIIDTHETSGVCEHQGQEQLDQDLYPYKKAILEGLPAVMTAHLTFPLLDNELPSSLSRPVIGDLLRTDLGFEGIVISDCVEMKGLSDAFTPKQIIELGLLAGVDLFISSYSLKRSRSHQLRLAEASQAFLAENPLIARTIEQRCNTLKNLQQKKHSHQIPSLKETLDLHRKTLEKAVYRPLATPQKGFCLIELTDRHKRGINTEALGSIVTDQLLAHCRGIVSSTVMTNVEGQALEQLVAAADADGMTCVFLSADGYRTKGFDRICHYLEAANGVIHIALLDPSDLGKRFHLEWATRGFNACTGRMLADELNVLC